LIRSGKIKLRSQDEASYSEGLARRRNAAGRNSKVLGNACRRLERSGLLRILLTSYWREGRCGGLLLGFEKLNGGEILVLKGGLRNLNLLNNRSLIGLSESGIGEGWIGRTLGGEEVFDLVEVAR
jgi:hypothetical protein